MKVSREDFPLKFTDQTLDYLIKSVKKENSHIVKFSMWLNTQSSPYTYSVGPVLNEDVEMDYDGCTFRLDGNSIYFMKGSLISVKQNEKGELGLHIQNPNIPKLGPNPCVGCSNKPKEQGGSCGGSCGSSCGSSCGKAHDDENG